MDRVFSGAVLNGVHSFHASTAAFMQFWNESFWEQEVQESIRRVAAVLGQSLEFPPKIRIEELTGLAFTYLGQEGVISNAISHSCKECTQPYKEVADRITADEPAAVLGIDENRNVPLPENPEEAQHARADVEEAQIAANVARERENEDDLDLMDMDNLATVKMVVLDGIIMGPQHCAFHNCTEGLANAHNGVFHKHHEAQHDNLCRVKNCNNLKQNSSQACEQHQGFWYSHVVRHGHQSLLGVCPMLRRREEERLDWLPQGQQNVQPHDQAAVARPQRNNYFVASHFYYVETICAPCSAVIAWEKFDKAESPTNILNFLERVYLTEQSRPSYICIDKACQVLRTCVHS